MKFHCLTIIFTCTLLMAVDTRAEDPAGRARATDFGSNVRFSQQRAAVQPAGHHCDDPSCQSCDGTNCDGTNCDGTHGHGKSGLFGLGRGKGKRGNGKHRSVRYQKRRCKDGKCGKCSKCKSGCYSGSCKKSGCCLCGAWKSKADKFCKHCTLYGPGYGWAPPIKEPLDNSRNGVQFQRYWPSRWYGSPGSSLAYSGAPMVYQPTDTTQLGYYYQHVPTWTARPGMLPPAPSPDAWHRRGCPSWWKHCSHGYHNQPTYANCPTCQPGYPMQGSVIYSSPAPGKMQHSEPMQPSQPMPKAEPMPQPATPMPAEPAEPQKTIPQSKDPVTLQVPQEFQTPPPAPPLISVEEKPLPN